jgi:proteic killer suppression protein
MIKSFRHKALEELFRTRATAGIDAKYHERLVRRLDAIHSADDLKGLNLPGWNLHPLKGKMKGRHAIAVSGPWRVTFEFKDGDAYRVDFEQYH